MDCLFLVGIIACYLAGATSDYTDPHCGGKQVIVHLFEWTWPDIALECERFLSKKGFCGVQVSPANEHVMVTSPPRPWWERYQPVSYKLHSRSGTEAEFTDMVNRCRAVGVRIYVDVLLNHMAALTRNGTGTAGSSFNADEYDFPGVPYREEHFNPYCELNSYNGADMIKNCYLVGLTDLDQSNVYVRDTLVAFLNKLISVGVAGFRVDAAKHMWVADIAAIQDKVRDLPEGGRPFFYHEVIDQSNGPVTSQQYTSLGYVTEFRYCQKLKDAIDDFGRLGGVVDYNWGMTDSDHAFVFVDNHDNERGHGGGGSIITFETPLQYKMAVAFILANDYGFTRVMSSYYFGDDSDAGPPHNDDYSTKHVPVGADETSCGDEWVCEHRWRPIANMVAFRNAVVGTTKDNFYSHDNEVAFSRGNVGFFAMARNGYMDTTLQTGLPAGEYCDLISECARKVTVNSNGEANIVIDNPDEPVLAIIVESPHNDRTTLITATTAAATKTSGTSSSHSDMTPTSMATRTTAAPPAPSTAAPSTAEPSTAAPHQPTTPDVPDKPVWNRTIVMIEKPTETGEFLFIRGGLDHDTHPDMACDSSNYACAIPIRSNIVGRGEFYDAYNAWSVNDDYLDWNEPPEPSQGTYEGRPAEGTPTVWTTNDRNKAGYNELNTYGDHYWLLDMNMDCSKTENGWFELKAVVGEWEQDITSATCTGNEVTDIPARTNNHWAKCAMFNVYHFENPSCEIKRIPSH